MPDGRNGASWVSVVVVVCSRSVMGPLSQAASQGSVGKLLSPWAPCLELCLPEHWASLGGRGTPTGAASAPKWDWGPCWLSHTYLAGNQMPNDHPQSKS